MIRALMMIFNGSRSWERIKVDQTGVAAITLRFLVPMILLTTGVEVAGLVRFGAAQGAFGSIVPISRELALKYGAVHVLGLLLILYVGSVVLQKIGATFHRRHSYTECFTTLTYSLSGLMLMRIPDAFPQVPTWVCYAIGIFLTLSIFYRGVPTILKPDPSNALGLFMFCSFLLLAATGLVHFLGTAVLSEQIKWRF
jgi:hypothetical protein